MSTKAQPSKQQPSPENWPVTLTVPAGTGEDKLQALLTAAFLQEEIGKRRRAEQELRSIQDRFSSLALLQKEIAGSYDLDSAARRCTYRVLELTPALSVAIAFAEHEQIVCRACAGSPAPAVGTVLDMNEGLLAECVRSGRVQVCHDTEADERVNVEACRALGVCSLAAVPICSPTGVLGLVAAFCANPRDLQEEHVAVLESIANLLSLRASSATVRTAHQEQQPARISPEVAEMLLARAAPPKHQARSLLTYGTGIAALLVLAVVFTRVNIVRQFEALAAHVTRGNPPASADVDHSDAVDSVSDKALTPSGLDALRERAARGDADAQFDLGVKYAAGSGVHADDKQAAKWIASAAAKGNVRAQQMLGDFYLLGRGVPKDLVKAYAWSSRAAAAGDEAGKTRATMLKAVLTKEQAAAGQKLAAQPVPSSNP